MPSQPDTVVLVHGAGAGSWMWDAVRAELEARGVPSVAVDLPTVGEGVDPALDAHADAAYLRGVLDSVGTGIVLCGNSYGGVVITEAAAGHAGVAHLVYVAAFMPDGDDDLVSFMVDNSSPEFLGGVVVRDDGLVEFDPSLVIRLAFQQAPGPVADAAAGRLRPMAMAGPSPSTVTGVSWRGIPSTYVVCGEDRSIKPESQRRWARQRASESVDLPYDHCPELSHPVEVAELLSKLATTRR
jgi:pimeloyl-ACP methyl ester carboxylesterase